MINIITKIQNLSSYIVFISYNLSKINAYLIYVSFIFPLFPYKYYRMLGLVYVTNFSIC